MEIERKETFSLTKKLAPLAGLVWTVVLVSPLAPWNSPLMRDLTRGTLSFHSISCYDDRRKRIRRS